MSSGARTCNEQIAFLNEQIARLEQCKLVSDSENNKKRLAKIKHALSDNRIRITVVGEFSSGKSTFINALIGKDLLPSANRVTTAAITYIYNVAESDPKCGRGKVIFRNGTHRDLEDFTGLRSYIAQQSDRNVEEEIDSVELYLHYFNTDQPLVIIDTPGLNATYAKHKEITFNELKHAHACIFVLGSQGLKDSSTKELLQMTDEEHGQGVFFFLQNRIDELNAQEGETLQGKLDALRANIEDFLELYNRKINYEIIGISALKALVGRDAAIPRLFRDDPEPLTPEQRRRVLDESNYAEFQSCIEDMLNTGELLRHIVENCQQRLLNYTDDLITAVSVRMESIMAQEEGRKPIADEKKEQAESIDGKIEKGKRRIANFISSKRTETSEAVIELCRQMLQEFIGQEDDAAPDTLASRIIQKIPDYDTLNQFEKINRCTPDQYFSRIVTEWLNTQYYPFAAEQIKRVIEHLYRLAASRIEEYVGNDVTVTLRPEAISLDLKPEPFAMKDTRRRAMAEDAKKDFQMIEKKLKQLLQDLQNTKAQIPRAEQAVHVRRNAVDQLRRGKQSELSRLGPRPPVGTREEPYPYQYTKGHLWWKETVTETRYRTVPDDSDIRRWVQNYSAVCQRYDSQILTAQRALDDAEYELEELISAVSGREREIRKQNEKRQEQIQLIQMYEELYREAEKLEKKAHCKLFRISLLKNLSNHLIGNDSDDDVTSVLSRTRDDTRKTIGDHEPILIRNATDTFVEMMTALKKEMEQEIEAMQQEFQLSMELLQQEKTTVEQIKVALE